MTEDPSKRRLGRGLAALIGDIERPQPAADQPLEQKSMRVAHDRMTPIELLKPNPRNPRKSFDEAELNELAQSIRKHGMVQPVIGRPSPTERGYIEIIAGERRWRAAQKAGLIEVPVIVREVDDRIALELAIIENVQRADLNAVEEAKGYQQLIDEHGYTQVDLAQVIGKSRSHVANTLRLLKLPDGVRDMIITGELSAGHARTLITADDPAALARQIIDGGLSVRQAEALSQQPKEAGESRAPAARKPEKDTDTLALEKQLSDVLGLKVSIGHKDNGSGEVRLSYRTLEQLDELQRRLTSQ